MAGPAVAGGAPELSAYRSLQVDRHGPVGWLVFDRPDSGNAMDATMLAELEQAWRELGDDPAVRVVVTTGQGRAFQTGLDVVQLARDPEALREQSRRTRRAELRLTAWHNQVWKPVVAAVNGVCAGGGLHFVADADVVICSSDTTFLDPHVSIGQVAAYEAIGLARRMPFEAVMRMALLGRHERISADRALALGMVSQVVDPPERLRDEAQELAERIARNSPAAMAATKRALWGALEAGLTEACRSGAKELVSLWGHPDQEEGPRAFAERREPRWAPPGENAPPGGTPGAGGSGRGSRNEPATTGPGRPPGRAARGRGGAVAYPTLDTLLVERHGPVGWLVNNRPDRLNAMNAHMRDEFETAWRVLDEDPEVRVIVHTGSGRAFQTGVDVAEIAGDGVGMERYRRSMEEFDVHFTAWHNQVWKPVVTAVNGICAGGGFHWVADADVVICASDAQFFDPHVSIGQVVAIEAIGLARRMPFEAVMRMALLGRHERISADRALALGMVSQVVDPPERLRDEAQELAERIARNSPAAMAATKRALWGALEAGLTEACRSGAKELVSLWGHPDQEEGPRAFAERREPRWAPPGENAPPGGSAPAGEQPGGSAPVGGA